MHNLYTIVDLVEGMHDVSAGVAAKMLRDVIKVPLFQFFDVTLENKQMLRVACDCL